MKKYTVHYQRDRSGWWVAQVKQVPAAISQGRTLAEARRRVREALSVVWDDEELATKVPLIDIVNLSASTKRVLKNALSARARLAKEMLVAQSYTMKAVQILVTKADLSVRDVGELLNISHQRVHQLMAEAAGEHPGMR